MCNLHRSGWFVRYILAVCIKHVGMLLINTVCFAIIIVFVVLVFASHAFNVPFSLSI